VAVQLDNGKEWKLKKRYSDFLRFHEVNQIPVCIQRVVM
jgi:hypothetical protein